MRFRRRRTGGGDFGARDGFPVGPDHQAFHDRHEQLHTGLVAALGQLELDLLGHDPRGVRHFKLQGSKRLVGQSEATGAVRVLAATHVEVRKVRFLDHTHPRTGQGFAVLENDPHQGR